MQPTRHSILILTAFVGTELMAVANAQESQFKPGDRVIVVSESAELRVGSEVAAKLSKGQQLKVTAVRNQWVGCSLEFEGQRKTGWILASQVTIALKDSEEEPAKAKKAESEPDSAEGGQGTDDELKKLRGTWLLDHSLSSGGFVFTSTGINNKLIFDGGTAQNEAFGERSKPGTVKIDPTKTPKQLDVTIPGTPRTRLGIYEFEGERLRISWAGEDGKRPPKFDRESRPIDVYERVK